MKEHQELLKQAREARKNSYAPYSGFTVGAALLARNGRVFTGCNIENASFTPTCCAERVAIFKAVSEGLRGEDLLAIAVVGGAGEETPRCYPCGVCRQVLAEFCGESFAVILSDERGEEETTSLGALLPNRFQL